MGSEQKITIPALNGNDTEAIIIEFDRGLGKVLVHGNTVPVDTAEGYAPGCIFMQADGGVGTTEYVNEGTLASADFNARS